MQIKCIYIVFSFVLVLSVSCNQGVLYEKDISIENHTWSIEDTLNFVVNIPDSLSFYDLNINVRNGGRYAFSNLFVFVEILGPSGNFLKDTIELTLANSLGEWYGKGLGDIKSVSLPYRRNARFSLPGIYKFKMVQGMRQEDLEQIFDIGLRIEKSKTPDQVQ